MNILRWIISAPISIVILGLLCIATRWYLGWIYNITSWGALNADDLELILQDFHGFIFITCLSTLISACISGCVGGKICPEDHGVATACLFGIVILPIIIFSCVAFWNTEHWFYSSVWILDMIISGYVFIESAVRVNKGDI